jgi:hypothetical protein
LLLTIRVRPYFYFIGYLFFSASNLEKMVYSRKNRKGSRKNRKSSRKNRRNSRRNNSAVNMMGGAYDAGKLNLLQGEEYQKFHMNQHGGGLTGAPLSAIEGSLLDSGLRASARVGPLDSSLGEIRNMSDIAPEGPVVPVQKGGRRRSSRRRGSRKVNRKSSRKVSRKNRKSSRKNRKGSR